MIKHLNQAMDALPAAQMVAGALIGLALMVAAFQAVLP